MCSETGLGDKELVEILNVLVRKECDTTLEILIHLAELEERKLHLKLGYSSLFAYCTIKLGYSEPAANRRIKAARCIRQYPETYNLLLHKKINLSTICVFYGVLTPENKEDLLIKVCGKSKVEVDRIVAGYREEPKKEIRDQVKPVVLRKEAGKDQPILGFNKNGSSQAKVELKQCDENYRRCDGKVEEEERVKITFAADRSFSDKIERMRRVLSGKYPMGADLETIFNEAMECYLDRHDPKKKTKKKRVSKSGCSNGKKSKSAKTRYIPACVKREVLKRDNYCCSYKGADGKACESSWRLEFDHITPLAKGGKTETDNLRVLCAAHNRLEAERELGKAFMDGFR
jgi:hypothetical protein